MHPLVVALKQEMEAIKAAFQPYRDYDYELIFKREAGHERTPCELGNLQRLNEECMTVAVPRVELANALVDSLMAHLTQKVDGALVDCECGLAANPGKVFADVVAVKCSVNEPCSQILDTPLSSTTKEQRPIMIRVWTLTAEQANRLSVPIEKLAARMDPVASAA